MKNKYMSKVLPPPELVCTLADYEMMLRDHAEQVKRLQTYNRFYMRKTTLASEAEARNYQKGIDENKAEITRHLEIVAFMREMIETEKNKAV